jgi:WD40 repeat protein
MENRSAWAVAFSPDGTRYATSAGEGSVQVWDSAQPPRMVRELKHPWRVVALSFHADGERLVTASTDRQVRLWSTATGGMLSESSAHRGAVWAVAVSPDGRLVATAGRDRCVRVWDAATGTPVGAPLRHREVVWAATFGRGRDIWSGSEDGTLRRWQIPDTTLAVPDEHVEAWAETVTGQRLDGDHARALGASEWKAGRDRLLAAGVRVE